MIRRSMLSIQEASSSRCREHEVVTLSDDEVAESRETSSDCDRVSITQEIPVITIDSDSDSDVDIEHDPVNIEPAPQNHRLRPLNPEMITYDEADQRYQAYCQLISENPKAKSLFEEPKLNVKYLRKRICSMYCDKLTEKKRNPPKKVPAKPDKNKFIFDPSYYPRNKKDGAIKRYQLIENLRAPAEGKELPVYCDYPMTSTDVIFSSVTVFNHENENTFSQELVDPNQKKSIIACCTCTDRCALPKCQCLRLQRGLCGSDIELQDFGIVEDHNDYFGKGYRLDNYTNVLVTCGDLCECSKDKDDLCRNHIDKIIQKHQLEYFRHDVRKGFGLRTLNPIPMDQLVCEFVGCVKPSTSVAKSALSMDYSFEQSSSDLIHLLRTMVDLLKPAYTDDDLGIIFKGSKYELVTDTFIDPFSLGNEARLASHSCTPNMGALRVISNYLHPYYHRIFYKALVPIPAGTELTISYGPAYVRRGKFKCLCGTILCKDADLSQKRFVAALSFDQTVDALMAMVLHWNELLKDFDNQCHRYRKRDGPEPVAPAITQELAHLQEKNAKILKQNFPELEAKRLFNNKSQYEKRLLEREITRAVESFCEQNKEIDRLPLIGPIIDLTDDDDEMPTDDVIETDPLDVPGPSTSLPEKKRPGRPKGSNNKRKVSSEEPTSSNSCPIPIRASLSNSFDMVPVERGRITRNSNREDDGQRRSL